jgi:ferredoxin
MVIADLKPIEEIKESIKGYKRVLNVGCAGCTAVCLAGGQKEVDILNAQLAKSFKEDQEPIQISGYTVERQCEMEFVAELDHMIDQYDAILSMACGAGVQFIAERFTDKPVFPALNTTFIGVNRDVGWYEEKCRSCGDCQLAYTAGICPVTRCAKSIFNGPCGGTQSGGKCELDKDVPCAWYEICERLKAQGRLDNITKLRVPMSWQNQKQGVLVLEAYKDRYAK